MIILSEARFKFKIVKTYILDNSFFPEDAWSSAGALKG